MAKININTSNTDSTKTPFWKPNKAKLVWLSSFLGMALTGFIALAIYMATLTSELPNTDALQSVRPVLSTELYDDEGKVFHSFFTENRQWVTLDSIPEVLIQAITSAEDRVFYDHWGMNITSIPAAVYRKLTTGKTYGGSGLTQQLAKNLFLTPEKSIARKLKEVMTAVRIEQTYTKDEILELYINQVYLGAGCYGFRSAAEYYFKTPLQHISAPQAATLAAMLPSPQSIRPDRRPEKALRKRNTVLRSMNLMGHIEDNQLDSLIGSELIEESVHAIKSQKKYGEYYIEEVRKYIEKNYGEEGLYSEGHKVHTTFNPYMQKHLEDYSIEHVKALQENLKLRYARRFRFTKHFKIKNEDTLVANFDSLFIEYKKMYREKTLGWVRDSIHHPRNYPNLQVGGVLIENKSGAIKAMVGGLDFKTSKYNRSTQAKRQPGSSFKPFVFALAMQSGMLPSDSIIDQPITIKDPKDTSKTWRPKNYEKDFEGMTTIRRALYRSKNLPTLEIAIQLGLRNLINLARKFGLQHSLPSVPSLAIGSAEATVLEMTAAYSAFPNSGLRSEPFMIQSMNNRQGEELESHIVSKKHVLSPQNAFFVTSMLRDVNTRGTAAKIWGSGFHIPSGGKTGTTNDYVDAWYIGFTPEYTLGIWVGADNNTAMGRGHTGGDASTPIWIKTMKAIYKKYPETGSFKKPNNIGHISLCPISHLHASKECPKDRRSHDFFPRGRYPKKCVPATDHEGSTVNINNDLFNDSGDENSNSSGIF